MLIDTPRYFYECEKCKTTRKPLAGECCVFCSYGTVTVNSFYVSIDDPDLTKFVVEFRMTRIDFQGQKYIFVASAEEQKTHSPEKKEEIKEPEHPFKMIAIQTGNSDVGYTEVVLPENIDKTKIVIKGAYALLSKMKNSEEEE